MWSSRLDLGTGGGDCGIEGICGIANRSGPGEREDATFAPDECRTQQPAGAEPPGGSLTLTSCQFGTERADPGQCGVSAVSVPTSIV